MDPFRCLPVALALFVASGAVPAATPTGKGGLATRMVRVTANRFQVPHLAHYPDPRILEQVNRQIDETVADMGCAEPGQIDKTLKVKSAVKLAAREVFSVYISGSYFCGAYPENDDVRSITFDLRTGKPVSFEALFKNYDLDKKIILSTIFARQVQEAIKHPDPGTLNEDASCAQAPWLYALDALESSDYTFNLTNRGLEVQPIWPHVIQACAQRVTIPYSRLKKFAAPDGLITRLQG
jgi:hypothetical protein